jgi:hypothetical protein
VAGPASDWPLVQSEGSGGHGHSRKTHRGTDRLAVRPRRSAQHDLPQPEAWLARERYLAEHPTAIAVLKCMDGRINIPVATNTPVGILMPFRNLGGIFDLGWPHLGEVLAHHVQRVVSAGRHVVFLVTYHYSQGDPRRGCAGFDYDTAAAIAHTYEIRRRSHTFSAPITAPSIRWSAVSRPTRTRW